MSELLPCPFCGGEPEMFQIGQNKIKIKCTTCLVEKEQKVLRYSIEWLKDHMINWWNCRFGVAEKETQKTEEQIYDDEHPDYIKASQEEI